MCFHRVGIKVATVRFAFAATVRVSQSQERSILSVFAWPWLLAICCQLYGLIILIIVVSVVVGFHGTLRDQRQQHPQAGLHCELTYHVCWVVQAKRSLEQILISYDVGKMTTVTYEVSASLDGYTAPQHETSTRPIVLVLIRASVSGLKLTPNLMPPTSHWQSLI